MTRPSPAAALAGLSSSGMTTRQFRDLQAGRMSEADLQDQVRRLTRVHGWLGCHTHRSDRSEPGFPDLVLVRGDQVLWRELKSRTGRIRPDQQTWLDALAGAGQDVGIWRPEDLLEQRIDHTLRRTP